MSAAHGADPGFEPTLRVCVAAVSLARRRLLGWDDDRLRAALLGGGGPAEAIVAEYLECVEDLGMVEGMLCDLLRDGKVLEIEERTRALAGRHWSYAALLHELVTPPQTPSKVEFVVRPRED